MPADVAEGAMVVVAIRESTKAPTGSHRDMCLIAHTLLSCDAQRRGAKHLVPRIALSACRLHLRSYRHCDAKTRSGPGGVHLAQ
jgi:hypothetical protein